MEFRGKGLAKGRLRKLHQLYELDNNECNDYNDCIEIILELVMASLTIRQLDEDIKSKLRIQAAQHGCSMEAEARAVLAQVFADKEVSVKGIASSIAEIVSQAKGFDLPKLDRKSKPSQRHLDFSDEAYG